MTRLVDIKVSSDTLARACAGDECAQSSIYAALAPSTFALIRRLAGSRTLAEDLFQDTMMTVYQSLPAFRGEAPLGAWVKRIAVSKCLMYLRSPWHRARLRLAGENDEDAQVQQVLLPATLDPKAETLDVERALSAPDTAANADHRRDGARGTGARRCNSRQSNSAPCGDCRRGAGRVGRYCGVESPC
jgi:RNA polymerase sigma-70 factor (ECF subfamily)